MSTNINRSIKLLPISTKFWNWTIFHMNFNISRRFLFKKKRSKKSKWKLQLNVEYIHTFPTNDDALRECIECHLLNYSHKIFSVHGQSDWKTNEMECKPPWWVGLVKAKNLHSLPKASKLTYIQLKLSFQLLVRIFIGFLVQQKHCGCSENKIKSL